MKSILSSFLIVFLLQTTRSATASMQDGYLRQGAATAASNPTMRQIQQFQAHEDRNTVQRVPSNSVRRLQEETERFDGNDFHWGCSGDNLLVGLEMVADGYANETTWKIVRNVDGVVIQSGFAFLDNQLHFSSPCLPKNCYTFTILDLNGDGICCDYGLGKYNLTTGKYIEMQYAAERVIRSGGVFGAAESTFFGGECRPLRSNSKTNCVNMTVSMTTRKDPRATNFYLFDVNINKITGRQGNNIWTDHIELPNHNYTFTKCVDPRICYQFHAASYSSVEDLNPTDIIVTYNGTDVELSGKMNKYYALLGEACAVQLPCVNVSLSLNMDGDGLEDLQIYMKDTAFGEAGSNMLTSNGREGKLSEFTGCVDPFRCYQIGINTCIMDSGNDCSSPSSLIPLSFFENELIYNGTAMITNVTNNTYYYVGETCSGLGLWNNKTDGMRRTLQKAPSFQDGTSHTLQLRRNSVRRLQGGFDGEHWYNLDCSGDNMLVGLEMVADGYANETTWKIVRDVDGFVIQSGFAFLDHQIHTSWLCLPKNCYTFTILDSNGDGICCDYGLGKYNLTTGKYVEMLYAADRVIRTGGMFGASESTSFGGECQPVHLESKTKCVNMTVSFTTRKDPWATNFRLFDINIHGIDERFEANIWTGGTASNPDYNSTQCIDPRICYQFEADTYSSMDNLNPTDITVTYNGTAVELSGERKFYYASVGGGCAVQPCVNTSLSLNTKDAGLEVWQVYMNEILVGEEGPSSILLTFHGRNGKDAEFIGCVDPLRCYKIGILACQRETGTECESPYRLTPLYYFENVLTYNGTIMITNFTNNADYYVGDGCSALGYTNNETDGTSP